MSRSVTCLAVCAALLAACGSSAAHTQPSRSTTTTPAPTPPAPTTTTTTVPDGGPPGGGAICGPAGARTLAADARARVYVAAGHVLGCAQGAASPIVLGQSTSCLGGALAGPVAVSGVRVAFGLKRCGVDTGHSSVVVRRLDTGQVVSQRPATQSVLGAESYVTVAAIVLARNGAVAWISEGASIVSRRRAVQVHVSGPSGTRVVDSGAGIWRRSLRLSGSVVRWRDRGRLRSARMG